MGEFLYHLYGWDTPILFYNIYVDKEGCHTPFLYKNRDEADFDLEKLRDASDKGAYRIVVKRKKGK